MSDRLKRIIVILAIIAGIVGSACAIVNLLYYNKEGKSVEIGASSFATQLNAIYADASAYLGGTITLEGIYTNSEIDGKVYHSVYRLYQDAEGSQSYVGIEFVSADNSYPEKGAWVKVSGTLKSYSEDEGNYLQLVDATVVEKAVRGSEIVSR